MKKTLLISFLLSSSLFFGGTSPPVARAESRSLTRGAVVTEGPSVRAVVRGPVRLRAYAGFNGGRIFTAPVVKGTDEDCTRGAIDGRAASATPVLIERALNVEVPAGQVACLETTTLRSFELLYRAYAGSDTTVAQAPR